MPLVTTPSSPWESYPIRQHSIPSSALISLTSKSSASVSGASQHTSATPHQPLNTQPSLRDLTVSPTSRGSISSTNTMVNSRGSLSSLGSIGTISSRASIGSLSSIPPGEGSALGNSESSLNLWQHDEAPSSSAGAGAPGSGKGSVSSLGSVIGTAAASTAYTATLSVSGLSRDLTLRECQYIFALATDFVSVEMSRNAVSGDVLVTAKFSSLHGAQQASQLLERRVDLFGGDVKASVQSYTSPFVSQSTTPRSLYPSRPLFAESYWSQQPSTPMSPSNAGSGGSEIFSSSRRQSLISPTDAVFTPNSSLNHMNLGAVSSSNLDSALANNSNINSGKVSPTGTGITTGIMSSSSSNSPSASSILPSSHSSISSGPSASAIGTIGAGVSMSSGGASSHSLSQRPSLASLSSAGMIQSPSRQQAVPGQQQSSHNGNSSSQSLLEQGHQQQQHYGSDAQKLPPPNPADQNPPCNTLYVGNLPPDTSEAELKALFSQQPGYRRLCFRTKQNGPMCFVEFEDVRLAGKALSELYGHALSNSVKGGIRLSYSKNPLGVRSRPARR